MIYFLFSQTLITIFFNSNAVHTTNTNIESVVKSGKEENTKSANDNAKLMTENMQSILLKSDCQDTLSNNIENENNAIKNSQEQLTDQNHEYTNQTNSIEYTKRENEKGLFLPLKESDQNQMKSQQVENKEKNQLFEYEDILLTQEKYVSESYDKNIKDYYIEKTKRCHSFKNNSSCDFNEDKLNIHLEKVQSDHYQIDSRIKLSNNTVESSNIEKKTLYQSKNYNGLDIEFSESENNETVFNQDEIIKTLVVESEKIEKLEKEKQKIASDKRDDDDEILMDHFEMDEKDRTKKKYRQTIQLFQMTKYEKMFENQSTELLIRQNKIKIPEFEENSFFIQKNAINIIAVNQTINTKTIDPKWIIMKCDPRKRSWKNCFSEVKPFLKVKMNSSFFDEKQLFESQMELKKQETLTSKKDKQTKLKENKSESVFLRRQTSDLEILQAQKDLNEFIFNLDVLCAQFIEMNTQELHISNYINHLVKENSSLQFILGISEEYNKMLDDYLNFANYIKNIRNGTKVEINLLFTNIVKLIIYSRNIQVYQKKFIFYACHLIENLSNIINFEIEAFVIKSKLTLGKKKQYNLIFEFNKKQSEYIHERQNLMLKSKIIADMLNFHTKEVDHVISKFLSIVIKRMLNYIDYVIQKNENEEKNENILILDMALGKLDEFSDVFLQIIDNFIHCNKYFTELTEQHKRIESEFFLIEKKINPESRKRLRNAYSLNAIQ